VYIVGSILKVSFIIFFNFFLCYNYNFLLKKGLEDNDAWQPLPLGCITKVYIVGFICQVGFRYPFFLCLKNYFLLEKGLKDNAAWPPPSPWLHYTGVYGYFYLPD